jgi:hypothetical protein
MDAALLPLITNIDAQYAALVLWALTSTAFNLKLLTALNHAHERFNTFVHELSLFNRKLNTSNSTERS